MRLIQFDEYREPERRPGQSIQERFEAFHKANPWVYQALVTLARDLVSRGRNKLGIGMLWEVLRWQYFMQTVDPSSDFKLNDHYRSRYVRLISANVPELRGRFETRSLRSE
jgi:hypothetical protein